MKIDTFSEIGSQHTICEDYIISGNNYIILADGCSSSEHSEMGARFLCYMARMYMKIHGVEGLQDTNYSTKLGSWVIHNAEMLVRQLGLRRTCLDATLVIAYIKDEYVHVHMFGDGYLVLKTAWGDFEIYCIDFKAGSKSMPYYLRYLVDEEGHHKYHEAKVTKTTSKIVIPKYSKDIKFEEKESAYDNIGSWHLPIACFKSISICSDGLGTFLKPKPDENGNKIMNVEDMISSMFDFKNSAGVFLQREINIYKRQLKKVDLKFEHFDDLSIGTFLMEEDPNDKDSKTE